MVATRPAPQGPANGPDGPANADEDHDRSLAIVEQKHGADARQLSQLVHLGTLLEPSRGRCYLGVGVLKPGHDPRLLIAG